VVKRLLPLSLAVVIPFSAGAAETLVVDEVVAVVGSSPVLASDLELATALRLVEPDEGESVDALRSRVLDARLRLEVQYRDLEASGTVYRLRPDTEAVGQSLAAAAGGLESLAPRLAAIGMTSADVDDLALRIATVDAYVRERLQPRVSVSLDELRQAYQDIVVAELQRRGEAPPALVEVRDELRRIVFERKLNGEIARWLVQARARQEVTVFAP
jgi:hypothetical protein